MKNRSDTFSKLRDSKILQAYYYIPLRKHPLLWVFSWTLKLICIAILAALYESALRPVPSVDQLNVTKGTLKEIVNKPRGGVYLVVIDIKTGEEIAFPSTSGRFPISELKLRRLRNQLGGLVELKWRKKWFPFMHRRDTWNFTIAGQEQSLISYSSRKNIENKVRPGEKTILLYAFVVALLLFSFPWFIYRKEIRSKEASKWQLKQKNL